MRVSIEARWLKEATRALAAAFPMFDARTAVSGSPFRGLLTLIAIGIGGRWGRYLPQPEAGP